MLFSLLGLLWYIGGTPPVLVLVGVLLHPTTNKPGRPLLFLLLMNLATVGGARQTEQCVNEMERQNGVAHILAKAIVVSRSRVIDGEYSATFRIDNYIKVNS